MAAVVSVVLVAAVAAQQQPPVFRGRIVLVPVDVRVLDRDGNPVRDLTPADFTILEDGVPQKIAHFAPQDYASVDPGAMTALSFRRPGATEPVAVNHRTFVIVLGRGRLQGPSKGLQAAVEFVRTRTLPHDHLAVVAYDRMTELTTDRESIVRFLDRYKAQYEKIEALLDHWFQGLTLAYGGDDPSPGIQKRIDDLFAHDGMPPFRQLVDLNIPGEEDLEQARRDLISAIGSTALPDGVTRTFVYNAAARQDLEKLYSVLSYLRYLEGEKHLLFISHEGHTILGLSYGERLATMASDARVSISTIHTAGLQSSWMMEGDTMVFRGPSWDQRWANAGSRDLAEHTGGVASTYEYAAKTIDRLERATRFNYLLGYYPTTAQSSGKERDIRIITNRSGVRVLYRHSYYARSDAEPFDRREFLTNSRISGAAGYRRAVTDVGVTISAAKPSRRAGVEHVPVTVTIDPQTVLLRQQDGRHVAELEVAVYVGTASERRIGEIRRRVDLRLTPESHAEIMKSGIVFEAVVEAKGDARHLKAVVYDYAADRLGSAATAVR